MLPGAVLPTNGYPVGCVRPTNWYYRGLQGLGLLLGTYVLYACISAERASSIMLPHSLQDSSVVMYQQSVLRGFWTCADSGVLS
jgi:hypothetical protein